MVQIKLFKKKKVLFTYYLKEPQRAQSNSLDSSGLLAKTQGSMCSSPIGGAGAACRGRASAKSMLIATHLRGRGQQHWMPQALAPRWW